jgi:hypothetical protein
MPEGAQSVPDAEYVIRRFDPDDDTHWTHDDAGRVGRLRQSALRFQADQPDRPDERNCSVYQESKLVSLGLDKWGALEEERPHWGVAAITAQEAREFSRDRLPAPNPFDVVEDEFPDGQQGAHVRDGAHAAISFQLPVAGADKWCRDLALRFVAERRELA